MPSRIPASSQRDIHPRLAERVLGHCQHAWRQPLHDHSLLAFQAVAADVAAADQVILDSGCGTGASTVRLAHQHPDALVIGVDKSVHRLARAPDLPPNARLVRAELTDFWRLARASGWCLHRHCLFYPNPWPKPAHLGRRWHAHPVFPDLLGLGGRLELRTNFQLYAREFASAVAVVLSLHPEVVSLPVADAVSPFERKYAASGHELFGVEIDLNQEKHRMKLQSLGMIALAGLLALPAVADDRLQAVIADSDRPADQADRDQFRNPFDTLTFFGIRPDMTVVELSPGGGWYTEILGPYLRDDGQLVAAHWNLDGDNVPDFYRRIRAEYEERIADTDRFGDIRIVPFDPPELIDLGGPATADLVLSFRNVHGWKRAGTFRDVARAAHAVLKPGGVFGIVSHRLPENHEQDPEARSGYVHQSWVIAVLESEGFRLVEASEINANPADTADHPNGVWSLLPGLRVPEGEDTEHFRAIGESDRFTLKFVKR